MAEGGTGVSVECTDKVGRGVGVSRGGATGSGVRLNAGEGDANLAVGALEVSDGRAGIVAREVCVAAGGAFLAVAARIDAVGTVGVFDAWERNGSSVATGPCVAVAVATRIPIHNGDGDGACGSSRWDRSNAADGASGMTCVVGSASGT